MPESLPVGVIEGSSEMGLTEEEYENRYRVKKKKK